MLCPIVAIRNVIHDPDLIPEAVRPPSNLHRTLIDRAAHGSSPTSQRCPVTRDDPMPATITDPLASDIFQFEVCNDMWR